MIPGGPRTAQPASADPARHPDHRPQLDGLRGLAALVVVAQHATRTPLALVGRNGFGIYGVWLFFVLSGFLITGILLRARDAFDVIGPDGRTVERRAPVGATLRAFYARRVLRIFPLYYAVVGVGTWLDFGAYRRDLAWHLAYLGNWLTAAQGVFTDATSPLWSLGVEEQFYLVWPLAVLLAPKRWWPTLPWVLAALGPLSRLAATQIGWHPLSPVSPVTPSTSNLDPLALGALLAWHHHAAPLARAARRRWTQWALRAGLALYGGVALLTILAVTSGRGITALAVLETVVGALVGVWCVDRAAEGFDPRSLAGRTLLARPVRYVGTISYGIYLLHGLVLQLLRHWVVGIPPAGPWRVPEPVAHWVGAILRAHGPATALAFGLVLAPTVALASLTWLGFERPLNALKQRFPYPRADQHDHPRPAAVAPAAGAPPAGAPPAPTRSPRRPRGPAPSAAVAGSRRTPSWRGA